MYKLTDDVNVVQELSSGKFIPTDERNIDYQEYKKWVAEGNTPLDNN